MRKPIFFLLFISFLSVFYCIAKAAESYPSINPSINPNRNCCDKGLFNGVTWYDQRDSVVNAHGTGLIEEGGRYYMFGEAKADSVNAFNGFSCYSSDNLVDWHYEGKALDVQNDGRLGPNRIGERPKVVRSVTNGEYVMIAHSDDRYYKDPCTVYATSKTVEGPYEYQGPLLYNGEPIKRWDIGAFTDDDGRSYLLVHHGGIYRFANDCRSLDSCMVNGVKGVGESPAMMKKDGLYYWLSSHTTSWERNDNMYFTAESISGPWTYGGLIAPEGTLTHNTQCSFVLPIKDGENTKYIYVGDRWSFPCQRSAATLVFLPLEGNEGEILIPQYAQWWNPSTTETLPIKGEVINVDWHSNRPGSTTESDGRPIMVSLDNPARIAVKGQTRSDGGYAMVYVNDSQGQPLYSQLVDFYSKVPSVGVRYITPMLPEGDYSIVIEATGKRSNWTDKAKNLYGTTGDFIRVDQLIILQ